jgi:hypothetical protein
MTRCDLIVNYSSQYHLFHLQRISGGSGLETYIVHALVTATLKANIKDQRKVGEG